MVPESTIRNHWTFYCVWVQTNARRWVENRMKMPKNKEKGHNKNTATSQLDASLECAMKVEAELWWMQKSNGMCLICRYYGIQCIQTLSLWTLARVICVNSSVAQFSFFFFFSIIHERPENFAMVACFFPRCIDYPIFFFHSFPYSDRLTYAHQLLTPLIKPNKFWMNEMEDEQFKWP